MIQGLVLTHGAIGAEMVKVVELIMGPVEGLRFDSNQGRSASCFPFEIVLLKHSTNYRQ